MNKKIAKPIVSSFAKDLTKDLVKRVNPTDALNTIVDAYRECVKVSQEEATKRAQIESDTKIALEQIKAQKDLFMTYLDRSFDERKENFERLFSALDKSIEAGSMEMMAHTLNSITELGKSSPFKDLVSIASVRKALDDPNTKFEF